MNDKKICFIMCSNDDDLASECLLYIEQLRVPDGFEVETLVVKDAHSMCSGYNEAMRASDAKYKIYLHQDVLLVYRGVIEDVVNLFEKHPEVGMIGMVGSTSLADDGCQWSDGLHRRIGEILGDVVDKTVYSMFGKAEGEYQPVVVIDGLFMATQYDVRWREDLFEGWDLYDSSQALEFWKAGYQVVVPYMKTPWCLHDNDIMNLENYEKWRAVFEREYKSLYTRYKAGAFELSEMERESENDGAERVCRDSKGGNMNNETDYIKGVVNSVKEVENYIRLNQNDALDVKMELLSALLPNMKKVADLLKQEEVIKCHNLVCELIENKEITGDMCDCLTEWNEKVEDWLKRVEALYGVCNICGQKVSYKSSWNHFKDEQKRHGFRYWNAVFESVSLRKRRCPVCVSMDRERMMALFLDMLKPEGTERLKALQIAPSATLHAYFEKKDYFEYETADLYMDGVTYNADIQDMYMIADDTYDIIICSHILEHVEDDRKAMRELGRILKPTGVCLFLVPIIIGLDDTDEEIGLSEEENWRRFGQNDHVRLYSRRDFLDRLTESGFLVHILNEAYFGGEAWKEAGLSDIHCLYVATKEDIGIGVMPYQPQEWQEELVSVIIPTYNRGYCIGKAIQSVLNQTYKNFELIIVDDASKDNTEEVVSGFNDDRIRYIKLEKNAGANHARNIGIQNASGKYIAFNDSDDEWLPKKLEKQMKLMQLENQIHKDSLAGVYCIMTKYDGDTAIFEAPDMDSIGEKAFGDIYDFMLGRMFISTQTLLLKKSVIEDVGYFNENLKRLQDWELLLRIAAKYKFTMVQESLVRATTQADCISNNTEGWIDTVLHVMELHCVADTNRALYDNTINTILGMLKEGTFSREYIADKIKQIETEGVLSARRMKNIRKEFGLDNVKETEACNINTAADNTGMALINERLDKLDEKINTLQAGVNVNNRMLNEILWSQVFASSRSAFEWLDKDIALWTGRWGVGYQYMYVVSRLLNDVKPVSILEMGLGQSTRLIASYIKWMSRQRECSHYVIEHDAGWIDIFENDFQICASTKIIQRDLLREEYTQQNGAKGYLHAYRDMDEVMKGRRFDFISIDGPYGVNDKNGYSRVDILDYLPACLADSFCIVLDDFERWGEKNTVSLMRSILKKNNIEFCETVYTGTQDLYLITSPDWKFLCTL